MNWTQLREDEPAGLRGIFGSTRARRNTATGREREQPDPDERGNAERAMETREEETPTGTHTAHIREERIPPPQPTLKLGTLNIQDGRRNRLNAALRCMSLLEVDIGLLTETKFANDRYTKYAEGYTVVGTQTDGRQGGVALIYRDGEDGWVLESTEKFGPNVIRSTLVSGNRRWYIIGVYIPPSEEDGRTLDFLTMARESVPNRRWPCIILGDLNVDPRKPEGTSIVGAERRTETAALLASMGMESIRENFRQGKRKMNKYWTWFMKRGDAIHGAICDHILSDKINAFTNCQIRIPRLDTDHFALVSNLELAS